MIDSRVKYTTAVAAAIIVYSITQAQLSKRPAM